MKVNDRIEFPADSNYHRRAHMTNYIMVVQDPRVEPGKCMFVKNNVIIAELDLRDEATPKTAAARMGEFDAMMINPDSVPEEAWEAMEADVGSVPTLN